MKMGTCEQPQPAEQQGDSETQREGLSMEENNLMITGPPASSPVIDNLKKLLLQRQHSRESDTENNRNIAIRSDQGSNSDAAFYSQFSTSSSDSDSSDYMIFQEISNQEGCNSNEGRRKHRRRRSYSSSSSSSSSPVARCRRKVTRVNVTLTNSIGGDGEAPGPQKSALDDQVHNNEYNDSANSTSSHKDSSSEDNFPGAANTKSLSSSEDVAPNRCAKLKSRRDRDRKRKRYELNYTSHRPKLLKATDPTTVSSSRNNEDTSQSTTGDGDSVPANGQDESKAVVEGSSSKDASAVPGNESASSITSSENKSELSLALSSEPAQTTCVSPASTSTINPVSPKTTRE